MTGFARQEGEHLGLRWAWELKTVNGRSQDIRMRLPPGFDALDPAIRAAVSGTVKRGNCQVSLHVTGAQAAGEVRINEAALDQVLGAIERIAPRLGGAQASPDGVLALKGVLELVDPESAQSEEAVAARNGALLVGLETALAELRQARDGEGARLEAFLVRHVDAIERLSAAARDCPARTPEAIGARLAEQIDRLLAHAPAFDAERLHQEAVLLAARADIAEELDRLSAHVAAARDLFGSAEPVGRRLDFLTQEFNREANTLCSKSNDTELTRIGLELKAVIDQMREQVQNIE
jgi:uncharacterized protein (TIGR00255 family)